MSDTIAAIATARGQSVLAVIRASGSEALAVAARVFVGTDLRSAEANRAYFGRIVGAVPAGARAAELETSGTDPGVHHVVDQVVATVFRAPRSSTGEDLVEITCHGGDVAARLVLQALLDAGARMAAPGEFTQRAFLNDKLDLAQAEAVAELIHASSTMAHRVSVAHLEGRYSERLDAIRDELLELAALVELELDFSEEDVEFADKPRLERLLRGARDYVAELLGSYRTGTMIRDGVRVVIAGKPNAGKSTLLNALVGRDRAIVSATPGTTRDEIESDAEIDGVRFVFTDTAGLRETGDAIEAEGVRRAEAAVDRADVLIYVYDVTVGLGADEATRLVALREANPDMPVLVVGNKADLVGGDRGNESLLARETASTIDGLDKVALSATAARVDPAALAPVTTWLRSAVVRGLSSQEGSAVVMNERHRRHLAAAAVALDSAGVALTSGVSGDVLAIDLRAALQELGAITGAFTNEDVLDQVFGRFCIGK